MNHQTTSTTLKGRAATPLCSFLLGALLLGSVNAQAAQRPLPPHGKPAPAHAMLPPPPMFMPESMSPGLPPELMRLQLSAEQEDRIFTLLHEQAPLRRQREKALHALRQEMMQLGRADTLDATRLRKLADEAAMQQAELDVLRVGTAVRVRALLSAEQRKALDEALVPPPMPAAPHAHEPAGRACQPPRGERAGLPRE
ncbi:Spy/CpxP family protein refolding chaperone [Viridibacterium curvum]|uniref:Periplasmic heavy metal sensor n=1 Tax=Viridibacterium curvum TaxID=1101404 RepID=A0ABP9QTV5_9RHOO